MEAGKLQKDDLIEVIDGRWKGLSGVVSQVIPIRVDGREIGERYAVALTASESAAKVPPLVTLLVHQLKKRD